MNQSQQPSTINRFHIKVVYASLTIALLSLLIVALMLWQQHQQSADLARLLTVQQAQLQQSMTDMLSQQLSFQQQQQQLMQKWLEQQRQQQGFATRHELYDGFMSSAIDAYFNLERQNREALQENLVQLDKTYHGLAPFLADTARHQLRVELTEFADLALRIASPWQELQPNLELQRKKADTMIDAMNSLLFSELFTNKDKLPMARPKRSKLDIEHGDQKEKTENQKKDKKASSNQEG